MTSRHIELLAISGSLRKGSSNSAVLEALSQIAPKSVTVTVYTELGDLPHFNLDLDIEPAPIAVQRFRNGLKHCDGIMISSPEYAHGVPGTLKNALDWVVSSGETVHKRFALINLSAESIHVQASLREILTVMMAVEVVDASIALPLHVRKLDVAGMIADRRITETLCSSISALVSAIG
jgi:NAD(P)H-dependent FMN reductase